MTLIDISSDFDLSNIPYLRQILRPTNIPPVSRGALWSDSTNRYVFDHGGHFYDSWGYNESEYFVEDADIPPYRLWRFDTKDETWQDMKPGGDVVQRVVAGAKCSIPQYNLSFYLGFKYVMLYDISEDRWYNQTTTFYNDELPEPRSRFCSVLVHDNNSTRNPNGSWELWVYGGQTISGVNGQGGGVDDIWVLTMPSFFWVKITDPTGDHRRGHACQALGSQLLVIGGGHPDGESTNQGDSCDAKLIKVFDLNNPSWLSSFTANTTYAQPSSIQKVAMGPYATEPRSGWVHPSLGEAFKFTPPPTPTPTSSPTPKPTGSSSKLSLGLGIGLGLGIPTIIAALTLLVYCYRRPPPQARPPGPGSVRSGRSIHLGSVGSEPVIPDANILYADPPTSGTSREQSSSRQTDTNTSTKNLER
ncbi:hypothetical protein FGG08_005574 [Glutinoglossum americanum]|uniref:Kelch repeat-containing protein n=1 Tax=Glutinoglossum americanum TaxID=1670608 RepID=A0A9P8KVX1_9PEZI|nr:hypothetical protein FGG08_005574 [Glutinoglossum americanum]